MIKRIFATAVFAGALMFAGQANANPNNVSASLTVSGQSNSKVYNESNYNGDSSVTGLTYSFKSLGFGQKIAETTAVIDASKVQTTSLQSIISNDGVLSTLDTTSGSSSKSGSEDSMMFNDEAQVSAAGKAANNLTLPAIILP